MSNGQRAHFGEFRRAELSLSSYSLAESLMIDATLNLFRTTEDLIGSCESVSERSLISIAAREKLALASATEAAVKQCRYSSHLARSFVQRLHFVHCFRLLSSPRIVIRITHKIPTCRP